MATGESVVQVLDNMPSGADFCSPRLVLGSSTPPEMAQIFQFPPGVQRYLDQKCLLTGYAGGGLNCTLFLTSPDVTTGSFIFEVGMFRLNAGNGNFNSPHTYAYQSGTAAVPAVAGDQLYLPIAFTDAQIDGWSNDELAIVRVRRLVDTANGDAFFWGFLGLEA